MTERIKLSVSLRHRIFPGQWPATCLPHRPAAWPGPAPAVARDLPGAGRDRGRVPVGKCAEPCDATAIRHATGGDPPREQGCCGRSADGGNGEPVCIPALGCTLFLALDPRRGTQQELDSIFLIRLDWMV